MNLLTKLSFRVVIVDIQNTKFANLKNLICLRFLKIQKKRSRNIVE